MVMQCFFNANAKDTKQHRIPQGVYLIFRLQINRRRTDLRNTLEVSIASVNIGKHRKTSQNVAKHRKTSQKIAKNRKTNKNRMKLLKIYFNNLCIHKSSQNRGTTLPAIKFYVLQFYIKKIYVQTIKHPKNITHVN